MKTHFIPPGIESLADVDFSDATYETECVVIQGVVSPSGQAWFAGRNDGFKVHTFCFEAWRRLDGSVINRRLFIQRPIPPVAKDRSIASRFSRLVASMLQRTRPDTDDRSDYSTYSIHRLSVLLSTDGKRAVVERALPALLPDEALRTIALDLLKPYVVSTTQFGDLVLNRQVDMLVGNAVWNGESIEISFDLDDDQSFGDALKTAETLWSEQSKWRRRIEDMVVRELLSVKNGGWLKKGESPITAEQFIARIKLHTISISPDGEFSFWHDDGDLFWGHAVQVSGNLAEGLTGADIPG